LIFVDTSFWVAVSMRADGRHDEAVALLDSTARRPLVTSSHVLGETWTFVRSRESHAGAVALMRKIRAAARLSVVFVDEEFEESAWEWLERRDERRYSFVDATSFAVMRRLRLDEALAFDGDFAAAGFTELRLPG